MKIVNNIIELDKTLTSSMQELRSLAKELQFINVVGSEFKLNKKHISEIEWNSFQYKGLYLFEIKNNGSFNNFSDWINDFQSRWEDEKYLKCFTPNVRKKRIKEHMNKPLPEWIPLYIGKSQKVEGKVHEHIFKELNKTTFALKLNARENLYNETFRIKAIELGLGNYSELMASIESELRDKINPIIGRQ